MKRVDVNVLLYAVNSDGPNHAEARAWLERSLSGTETVAFSWLVLLAFLRLSTRVAVFPQPLSLEQAIALIDGWLAQPCAVVLEPTSRHWGILKSLLTAVGTAGNLSSDAHLAALAIEHGAELCSADRDFARFPMLRWVNPLA